MLSKFIQKILGTNYGVGDWGLGDKLWFKKGDEVQMGGGLANFCYMGTPRPPCKTPWPICFFHFLKIPNISILPNINFRTMWTIMPYKLLNAGHAYFHIFFFLLFHFLFWCFLLSILLWWGLLHLSVLLFLLIIAVQNPSRFLACWFWFGTRIFGLQWRSVNTKRRNKELFSYNPYNWLKAYSLISYRGRSQKFQNLNFLHLFVAFLQEGHFPKGI